MGLEQKSRLCKITARCPFTSTLYEIIFKMLYGVHWFHHAWQPSNDGNEGFNESAERGLSNVALNHTFKHIIENHIRSKRSVQFTN